MGRNINKEMYKLDPVEVYNLVLNGKLKSFPNGYWKGDFGKDNARKCLIYLIEEKLKYTDEDIKKNFKCKTFHQYRLWGLLQGLFKGSPYMALEFIYPGRFKEWELSAPMNFWNNENGIKAVKWLFEEKLKLKDEDVIKFASKKNFCEYGLGGMLMYCFDSSPYKALDAAYPGKYKIWQLPNCPKRFWTEKTGSEAVRWLLEEKLKLPDDEIPKKVCTKVFKDNGLSCMVSLVFKGSVFAAINSAYPNKYKEWEFSRVPSNFWTNETAIKATKWLVEDKLKLSKEHIPEKIEKEHFINNGLNGMLSVVYNGSFFKAIGSAYPGEFKEWQFKNVYSGFWTKEKGIEATRWLFETKLKYSKEDIIKNASFELFKKNKLGAMLNICFKGSPYLAIEQAYNNEFDLNDFKNFKMCKIKSEVKKLDI